MAHNVSISGRMNNTADMLYTTDLVNTIVRGRAALYTYSLGRFRNGTDISYYVTAIARVPMCLLSDAPTLYTHRLSKTYDIVE